MLDDQPRRAIAAVLEESPEVVEAMLPVLAADGAKEPSLAQVDLIGLCIERALLPPMVIDDHVDVFLELFRGSVGSTKCLPCLVVWLALRLPAWDVSL